ncbi:MAG TPA: phosphate ABC transporter permease subunit PstC [Candidatus Aminicenantes bacterium]|jgi:phosphate transport system permease protein|nr:phosphate ABC transporter permease subunit PstC [Acidobacteriota bacterium]HOF83212.1 phosphate ABC transporter permease subunit PstC [Candidatus Aminicenantes bacterium]MDD8028128.1 phosphate ABC transporter permease subunit PstC [Acidobacteriota bacterium]HOU49434.1 phosphate ABC transporter permease subunit PstC [Candidatus Aminicenantes bacterium]HOY98322.1 phosphate ABC transporter permease subunit PstC [Candidatus Aminicenantes bacterium]
MISRRLLNLKERAIRAFFFLNGILVVVILAGIFVLLLSSAVPAFREIDLKEFLFGALWDPTSPIRASYGILTQIYSTFLVTLGAMILAVPVGLAVAAYLSDVAPGRVREIIKPVVEILAGVPSVVIGFLGIVVLGPALSKLTGESHGLNALNGSILLAIMSLPTIISISEDSLAAVPRSYSEGSLALGGSRWQTLLRVKFPAALSGIIAAVMLGMGRAIGETMTVLMATGNARSFPHGLFDSVRTMTSNVAIELGEVPYFTTHYYALFAIGLVLFLLTFLINLAADRVLHKYRERER